MLGHTLPLIPPSVLYCNLTHTGRTLLYCEVITHVRQQLFQYRDLGYSLLDGPWVVSTDPQMYRQLFSICKVDVSYYLNNVELSVWYKVYHIVISRIVPDQRAVFSCVYHAGN